MLAHSVPNYDRFSNADSKYDRFSNDYTDSNAIAESVSICFPHSDMLTVGFSLPNTVTQSNIISESNAVADSVAKHVSHPDCFSVSVSYP